MHRRCPINVLTGQPLSFQVADLYLRAHAKLTSYITFQRCIDLKVEMKIRLFFPSGIGGTVGNSV